MVECLTPRKVFNVAKNFLVNCSPLSVSKNVRMPYGRSQRSNKKFAMCVDVVLDVDIARVNLKY